MSDSRLKQQKIFTKQYISGVALSGAVLFLFYVLLFLVIPEHLFVAYKGIWALLAALLSLPFAFFLVGLLFIKPDMMDYKWLRFWLQGSISVVTFVLVLWFWNRAEVNFSHLHDNDSELSDVELLWALNHTKLHDIHKLSYHIVHDGLNNEKLDELSRKFGINKTELQIFIVLLKKIPAEKFASTLELEAELESVLNRYHSNLKKLRRFRTHYPVVKVMQLKARQLLKRGEFEETEALIKQIDESVAQLAENLGISVPLLSAFFDVIYGQSSTQSTAEQLAELQQLTQHYRDNLKKIDQFKTEDLEIISGLQQVKYFLEQGELSRSEEIIEHLGAQDLATARRLQALSDSYFSFSAQKLLGEAKTTYTPIAERLRTSRYYVNLGKLAKFRTEHAEIRSLQKQAKQFLEQGEFDRAEALIMQIEQQVAIIANDLKVSAEILNVFFGILRSENVSAEQIPPALRQMATSYHSYMSQLNSFKTENNETRSLLAQVKYFLDYGQFDRAESFLNRISKENIASAKQLQAMAKDYFSFASSATLPEIKDKNLKTANRLQQEANENLLSAAEAKAQNGELKLIQMKKTHAVHYFKEALEIIPKEFSEKLNSYMTKMESINLTEQVM